MVRRSARSFGALFIIPLEELMNDWFSASVAGLSQLIFGLILIVVILWRPRGFVTLFKSLAAKIPGVSP